MKQLSTNQNVIAIEVCALGNLLEGFFRFPGQRLVFWAQVYGEQTIPHLVLEDRTISEETLDDVEATHPETEVEILSTTEIRGYKMSKGEAGTRKVYFYSKFSKPFVAFFVDLY